MIPSYFYAPELPYVKRKPNRCKHQHASDTFSGSERSTEQSDGEDNSRDRLKNAQEAGRGHRDHLEARYIEQE